MERLAHAVPKRIALGRIETPLAPARYFALMAGAGLDAKIVTRVDSGLKERFGKGAYWAAGLSQIANRLEQFEVLMDGTAYEVGFALASRVRNYGGDLEIALDASLLKPEFEVVLFEGSNPLRYVAYMAAVGLKQVRKMPGVYSIHATSLEIRSCAHLQIDGEYVGRTSAKIEIVPDALTLLLLPNYG
jgi:diacylglycerol kinase family enzyme